MVYLFISVKYRQARLWQGRTCSDGALKSRTKTFEDISCTGSITRSVDGFYSRDSSRFQHFSMYWY